MFSSETQDLKYNNNYTVYAYALIYSNKLN